jgi:hypothetical protein
MPHEIAPSGSGAPVVKFTKIGDTFIGAYVGEGKPQQRRTYKPDGSLGDLMFKPDGKPALQAIKHFVAMPDTTAVTGNLVKGETYPIAAGDHVRVIVNGWKWGQHIEAAKSLPAFGKTKAGVMLSTDVYTVTAVGYSATAGDNAAALKKEGLKVIDGRVIMTTEEDHEKWVLFQVRNHANSNAAMDFVVIARRYDPATESEWGDAADALWLEAPWEQEKRDDDDVPAGGGGGGGGTSYGPLDTEEPFIRDSTVADL